MKKIDKTIGQIMSQIQTKEPSTKAKPISTDSLTLTDEDKELGLKLFKFETFDDPGLEKLLKACLTYCRNARDTWKPCCLSLCGVSGTGKTHLAKQVMHWFYHNIFNMYHPIFYYFPDVAREILSGHYGTGIEMMKEKFCVIDEIDKFHDSSSGVVLNYLNSIMNKRLDKWTIITSNKTLEAIGNDLDVAIADRMLRGNNRVIEIDTISYSMREIK